MSDTSPQPTESGVATPAVKQSSRTRWQIGLRSLLLFVTAIAVWLTWFNNRRLIVAFQNRIAAMRPLAHELAVDDAKRIAVVKLEEQWYDENGWDIYLPKGQYRLCIATRGIDEQAPVPAAKTAPLASGRHRVALEQRPENRGFRVTVTVDGTELLTVVETKDWDPGAGSMGGGQFEQSEQMAANKPVVLFRRRFTRRVNSGTSSTPVGPTEGVLLWIEQTATPETESFNAQP